MVLACQHCFMEPHFSQAMRFCFIHVVGLVPVLTSCLSPLPLPPRMDTWYRRLSLTTAHLNDGGMIQVLPISAAPRLVRATFEIRCLCYSHQAGRVEVESCRRHLCARVRRMPIQRNAKPRQAENKDILQARIQLNLKLVSTTPRDVTKSTRPKSWLVHPMRRLGCFQFLTIEID